MEETTGEGCVVHKDRNEFRGVPKSLKALRFEHWSQGHGQTHYRSFLVPFVVEQESVRSNKARHCLLFCLAGASESCEEADDRCSLIEELHRRPEKQSSAEDFEDS